MICRFEFKKQDLWIGAFWKTDRNGWNIWICLLPCLPLHISGLFKDRVLILGPDEPRDKPIGPNVYERLGGIFYSQGALDKIKADQTISQESDEKLKMIEDIKNWIDSADYRTLLEHWRNAPCGDLMLQGDTGEYYKKAMFEKRDTLTTAECVAASKSIGWEG